MGIGLEQGIHRIRLSGEGSEDLMSYKLWVILGLATFLNAKGGLGLQINTAVRSLKIPGRGNVGGGGMIAMELH